MRHLTLQELECLCDTLVRLTEEPDSFKARLDRLMLVELKNELVRNEQFEMLEDFRRIESGFNLHIPFVYNGEPILEAV